MHIHTSVDPCISMHRVLWIRSCRDLAVVLSVMWFVIGVLSLYLFFVSCLVSCLVEIVHRPLWTRSCCDLAVVWSVRRFAIRVLSLYLVLFFVWQSIRARKLSGLASCQEAVRSQVWEAAMGGCQVPDLGSS